MSRVTVRQAFASFLTPQTVPGLATVQPWPSKVTNEGEFDLAGVGAGFGAIVFVHLPSQREQRIALGGPNSGLKWREYQAVLLCVFRGNDPESQVVAQACDGFLDALVARLEYDRRLGTQTLGPAGIFQAGEGGVSGGDDIEVVTALPRTVRSGLTQIFATVTLQVAEVLQT